MNLSPPAALAHRDFSHHPESFSKTPRNDARQEPMSGAEQVVEKEEALLNTGVNFELGREIQQMLRSINELITGFIRDIVGRAREFISAK